eukprot:Gb_37487 [translate_table: standard]
MEKVCLVMKKVMAIEKNMVGDENLPSNLSRESQGSIRAFEGGLIHPQSAKLPLTAHVTTMSKPSSYSPNLGRSFEPVATCNVHLQRKLRLQTGSKMVATTEVENQMEEDEGNNCRGGGKRSYREQKGFFFFFPWDGFDSWKLESLQLVSKLRNLL